MGKKKLDYEIVDCYSNELKRINHKFEQLEKGQIYEFTHTITDDSLAANAKDLRKMVYELLSKIQCGEDGNSEKLGEILKMIRY